MIQSIHTIANHVTKDDNDTPARSRQLTNRADELTSYARAGYRLTHTDTVEGAEFVTFVDTLTKDTDY